MNTSVPEILKLEFYSEDNNVFVFKHLLICEAAQLWNMSKN